MAPDEMLKKVYEYIDSCFAEGKNLGQVLQGIQEYLTTLES